MKPPTTRSTAHGPLKRYLQHTVETLLAHRILRGDVLPGQTLEVTVRDGDLAVE